MGARGFEPRAVRVTGSLTNRLGGCRADSPPLRPDLNPTVLPD